MRLWIVMFLLISGCATKHAGFIAYCETEEWAMFGFSFRDDRDCYSLDAAHLSSYEFLFDRYLIRKGWDKEDPFSFPDTPAASTPDAD